MSPDVWAAGKYYEPFIGRWSRLVARSFLDWLDAPVGRHWLDVGCGPGALAQTILDRMRPASILGVDPSAAFIEYARAHVRRDGLSAEAVSFQVGDARALPVGDASRDAVVSGLVLNFVPGPERAVAEMARATSPGGIAAAYVWDYAGKMELLRYYWDAAVALDPDAAALDEGPRFPICRPEPLEALFKAAGLESVATTTIDVPTVFRDFDDYWNPFLGGQGPAPAYAMTLDEARRGRLRERLRARLPLEKDGSIHLIARAWAVRGIKS
ncbi:MAG TPA: class I SAM-dependent methyltransferase [Candidatus Omnitrophota bacterium]|jgi:SAM-dependent methyltransferase|nr:class I SAM-dependent methyltransferase [Candidatus Omnitrophota bacterium]